MPENKYKIAVIQLNLNDVAEKNLTKCLSWVREAAKMGAEVISLPELYSSHYFCQSEDVDNFARPLEYSINDLLPDVNCDFSIYQGGPVEQDNLYFVHKVPDLISESIEISNGIFWGGNFESLKNALNNELISENDIRFFLGYSGWTKNQLEREINSKSWFVSENDYENIFATNEEILWREKLLQKGGNYKLWANAPGNIQLN